MLAHLQLAERFVEYPRRYSSGLVDKKHIAFLSLFESSYK